MDTLLLAQISDLHVTRDGEPLFGRIDTPGLLRRAVAHLAALRPRPAAVLATGDLVESGTRESYRFLRTLLAPLPMPVFVLPGNHDDRAALRAEFGDHAYLSQCEPFVQYALDDWALRIVALDTVVPGEDGGRLCDERLAWLDRTLERAPRKPTLVVMHHPPVRTGLEDMDEMGLDNTAAFASVLARHPQVERIVCGHIHRPVTARFAGVPVSVCPSTAHQIALDLGREEPLAYSMEPPAYQLHFWSAGDGLVTHTAYVGAYDGPYPFG